MSAFILVFTLNWSEWGINLTMIFSKTYYWDLLYTDGLVNLTCILEKHVMPTPPLPTHLAMQVWHKVLPYVFVFWVSGAGRLGELQLHGWTPVFVIYEILKIGRKRLTDWLTDWFKYKGVCRTSPAKMGLLTNTNQTKIFLFVFGKHGHNLDVGGFVCIL